MKVADPLSPDERGKLAGVAFSGSILGIIITMPMSGFLVKVLGWEGMFYVFGVVGFLWNTV